MRNWYSFGGSAIVNAFKTANQESCFHGFGSLDPLALQANPIQNKLAQSRSLPERPMLFIARAHPRHKPIATPSSIYRVDPAHGRLGFGCFSAPPAFNRLRSEPCCQASGCLFIRRQNVEKLPARLGGINDRRLSRNTTQAKRMFIAGSSRLR